MVTEDRLSSRNKLCCPTLLSLQGSHRVTSTPCPWVPLWRSGLSVSLPPMPPQRFVVWPRTCVSTCCSAHSHQVAPVSPRPTPTSSVDSQKVEQVWEQISASCPAGFTGGSSPLLKEEPQLAWKVKTVLLGLKGRLIWSWLRCLMGYFDECLFPRDQMLISNSSFKCTN